MLDWPPFLYIIFIDLDNLLAPPPFLNSCLFKCLALYNFCYIGLFGIDYILHLAPCMRLYIPIFRKWYLVGLFFCLLLSAYHLRTHWFITSSFYGGGSCPYMVNWYLSITILIGHCIWYMGPHIELLGSVFFSCSPSLCMVWNILLQHFVFYAQNDMSLCLSSELLYAPEEAIFKSWNM